MSDEQEEVLTPHLWRVSRAQAPFLEATLSSRRHVTNRRQERGELSRSQAGHSSRRQAVLVLRTRG